MRIPLAYPAQQTRRTRAPCLPPGLGLGELARGLRGARDIEMAHKNDMARHTSEGLRY